MIKELESAQEPDLENDAAINDLYFLHDRKMTALDRAVYELVKVQEIVNRFLGHRLTFPACIAALDAALAGLVSKLKPDQLPELRAVMLANNASVMTEMEKRERARKANAGWLCQSDSLLCFYFTIRTK